MASDGNDFRGLIDALNSIPDASPAQWASAEERVRKALASTAGEAAAEVLEAVGFVKKPRKIPTREDGTRITQGSRYRVAEP